MPAQLVRAAQGPVRRVAVLGAVAFIFLLCAIAVTFELDATSQPTGGALDSTFLSLLALGVLLAVAVPPFAGRLALGQQR